MKVYTLTFNGNDAKEDVVEVKSLSEAFIRINVVENETRRNAVINGDKPYVVKKKDGVYQFILCDDNKYNAYIEKAKKKHLSKVA